MKNILYTIWIGALPLLAMGCAEVDVDQTNSASGLPNAIYLDGVDKSPMKKIVVSDVGGEVAVFPRSANLVDENVQIDIAIDENSLEQYNKAYGTTYKMLPKEYVILEKNSVTLKPGTVTAGPVKIGIDKKALTVNPSFKYAIPVKISSPSHLNVLESSAYEIFALDRVLETSIMRQSGFSMRCDLVPLPHDATAKPMLLKEWTLHYGMNVDRWFANQQPVMGSFYSRITPDGRLQYKGGGSDDPKAFSNQKMTPGKWFHITFTYKNQKVKMYIDGVFETEFDVTNNDKYYKIQASYGNFVGYFRDIRLYNKALTAFQITENLYVEDPANPNLIVYAPLDKANGLKDISGNNNHFKAYLYPSSTETPYDESKIKWTSPVYFPEQK